MYVVYNKDYVRHLINESKNQTFVYISDRMMYIFVVYFCLVS